MNIVIKAFLFISFILYVGCSDTKPVYPPLPIPYQTPYDKEIEEWFSDHVKSCEDCKYLENGIVCEQAWKEFRDLRKKHGKSDPGPYPYYVHLFLK